MNDIFDEKQNDTRLQKAKLYVDGDMTKALQMVEGKYKDITVLKLGFTSNDTRQAGLIIIFINTEKNKNHGHYCIISKGDNLNNTHPGQPWQENLLTLFQFTYSEKGDLQITGKLKHELEREFTPALLTALNEKISSKDLSSISLQFEKIISFSLRSNEVRIELDIEKTSSLFVDETIEKIRSSLGKKDTTVTEENKETPVSAQKYDVISMKDQELLAKGNKIVVCKFVLSPVKGKFVSQLEALDIVKIRINDNTPAAKQIAERLGWSKDGKMSAGTGKIYSITKLEKGNLIYIEIAPNLIGKIIEEEEVRVYVPDYDPALTGNQTNAGKKIMIWLLLIILILGIIGVVVIVSS